jgi:hypothetical protein
MRPSLNPSSPSQLGAKIIGETVKKISIKKPVKSTAHKNYSTLGVSFSKLRIIEDTANLPIYGAE